MEFILVFDDGRPARECVARWRGPTTLGVEFQMHSRDVSTSALSMLTTLGQQATGTNKGHLRPPSVPLYD